MELLKQFISRLRATRWFSRSAETVLTALLFSGTFSAQTTPRFEVVSIRPSAPLQQGVLTSSGLRVDGARVIGSRMTVQDLISYGYLIRPFQLGPVESWVSTERWDIQAALPSGLEPNTEQVRSMVRDMLAERFRLSLRKENRETAVYGLVLAPGGAKLRPATDPTLPPSRRVARRDGVQEWSEGKQSIQSLLALLSSEIDRPITNLTGLSGTYVFSLTFVPERLLTSPDAPAGPSLSKAIADQLGLKIEARKEPMEYLTIEHVERPSEN